MKQATTHLALKTGSGQNSFEWVDQWVKVPLSPQSATNGRTHGIVVTKGEEVIVFHQSNPAVICYSLSGNFLRAWGDRFLGAHGMTLVEEDSVEYLWLTDQYSGEVVKITLDGKTVQKLLNPAEKFSPTWVAVFEERFGGNGDIWVADGYGQNQVHRYNKAGEHIQILTGKEGDIGAFQCPHGIWIETRFDDPELFIADRSNHCVQVYDLEGNFKYTFGRDIVYSPCSFAAYEDFLVIPEIHARVAILDGKKKLVCYLGDDVPIVDHEAWPDLPSELVMPGKFVSPHAAAFDREGHLYVVEWMVGGRITKLAREK